MCVSKQTCAEITIEFGSLSSLVEYEGVAE